MVSPSVPRNPSVRTLLDHEADSPPSRLGHIPPETQVKDDAEALALINDSPYGLTSSIWTRSEAAYYALVDDIEAGTVFMNRCDYLDPALPWTGYKESGRGISLSRYGFDAVTKAKSLHIRPL